MAGRLKKTVRRAKPKNPRTGQVAVTEEFLNRLKEKAFDLEARIHDPVELDVASSDLCIKAALESIGVSKYMISKISRGCMPITRALVMGKLPHEAAEVKIEKVIMDNLPAKAALKFYERFEYLGDQINKAFNPHARA